MNKKDVKRLIEQFQNFEIDEKKAFIEAFADLGGFYVDIKDLVINTKVNFRKNKNGEYKAKVDIPNEWLDRLGVTRDDSDITMELLQDKITIRKYDLDIDYTYYDPDFDELDYDMSYDDFDMSNDEIEEISSEEMLESLLVINPNRIAARTLIEKGKREGYLTLSEIMEAFSEVELDKDKVENLYETLGNLGIEIVEEIDPIKGDSK